MTRTDPDPVFAAAVREELVRGAAASSSGRPRRSRLLRVELLASFAVIAVVIAVLVGVQPAHLPAHHSGSAPAAPATTATPSSSPAQLIGPAGAQRRTAAEIRAWGKARGLSAVMIEQMVLETGCMAAAGFRLDPIFDATADLRSGHRGMTPEQEHAYDVAEFGPSTSKPYDWRTAGCVGRAVHETGQDHAN